MHALRTQGDYFAEAEASICSRLLLQDHRLTHREEHPCLWLPWRRRPVRGAIENTTLPDKLETLEVKHDDNTENDGLRALDGFMCLVSGIKAPTLDVTYAKSLPAAASIVRHGKTLKQLNVHASTGPDSCDHELVYNYTSFGHICKECLLLEQISVVFPQVSVVCSKN
jgi:hypothetical protein